MKNIKVKTNTPKCLRAARFTFRDRGFTLLVAIVISSLLLSIGITIFNTTTKELRLSALGRDSQFAFYAADSGIECALYWDKKQKVFPESDDPDQQILPPSGTVFCNLQDITLSEPQWDVTRSTSQSPYSGSAITTFRLDFSPNPYCAITVISKVGDGMSTTTTIESRGYNTCNTTDPRRVERAIRTIYE